MENDVVKLRLRHFIKYKKIKLQDFMEMIGKARNYFSTTSNISSGVLRDIADKYPELNMTWVLTGEGEMIKAEEIEIPEISYTVGVPYYDEDFLLGFDELIPSDNANPEYLINLPKYNNATLWCNASGHSMEPEINNGDIVALQLIEDYSFLSYDNIYAIVTTNDMRTIKRIGKGSTPDTYRLIPTNKEFEEQDLPISKIRSVFRVLGCLKRY